MSDGLFICEKCGDVFPETCPKCPDRGDGRGVTVGTIREHLRAAPDRASLEATRKHYGRHIATLKRKGGDAKTMAIIIENLVAYQRNHFNRG